jgi:hypothetical protein
LKLGDSAKVGVAQSKTAAIHLLADTDLPAPLPKDTRLEAIFAAIRHCLPVGSIAHVVHGFDASELIE